MAAARQRRQPNGGYRSLKIAVRRLAEELDDPFIETAFGVAEKFHANSHHRFMQDYEFDRDRPAIRLFVQRIQSLMASE